MKNSQKGYVVPLLLAIIALLVVGGGVYIYETKKAEVAAPSLNIPSENSVTIDQNQTTNPQNESDSLVSTAGWATGTNMDYPADLIVTPALQGTQQGPTYIFPSSYFSGSSITSAKITSYSSCGSDVPTTNIVIEGVRFYKSANGLTYDMPGACNNAFNLTINMPAVGADPVSYQNIKDIFYTMIDSMAKKLHASTPTASSGSFSASPTNGLAPLTVQFSDSIGSAGDTSIDYGDGTSCSTANPDGSLHCSLFTHTYNNPGTYTAKLYSHLPTALQAQLTITVTGNGSSSGVSVTGMAQYTDSSFGFSFWYPNTWVVQNPSSQKSYLSINGGTIVKQIMVGPTGDLSNSILIQEFQSSDFSITDRTDCGPADGCPVSLTYRFDSSIHSWTKQNNLYGGAISTMVLSSFANTIGGLHLLHGNARFGDDYIVPLSASNFLVISSVQAGTIQEGVLAQTITATDPSVATPVSVPQQVQVIHNEGLMYGAIGMKVGDWYVDNQNVYDRFGNVISGANPTTFRLITTYSDGFIESLGTGFAADNNHVYSDWSTTTLVLAGADPASFIPIRQQYQIPYAPTSGMYGQSFSSYDTTFAKDKSYVWYEGRLIPGADPSTLVVTGMTGVQNSNGGYTLAHDAHHTYGVDTKNNITIDSVAIQM